jgi:hypothetical protein
VPRCNVTVANATVRVVCSVHSNDANIVDLALVTAAAQAAANQAVTELGGLPGRVEHTYEAPD